MIRRTIALTILLAAALIVGCSVAAQSRMTVTDNEAYRAAAAYSESQRGLSLLILKDGKTVFEEYHNGHSTERPWMLASGTKSFSGVLLATAIEDGIIKGFDEKVSDTITEWRSDERLSKMTVRQLLTLTGGIDAGSNGRQPSYSEAVKFKSEHAPGDKFEYGPVPFQVFGELMRRKLAPRKETVEQYLNRRILDPIGLKPARWNGEPGLPNLPSGAFLTAREWAKFGTLLINRGKWEGKQVIKASLLDELTKGTEANPNYGITFWLNRSGSGSADLVENEMPIAGRLRRMTGRNASETTEISRYGMGSDLPNDAYMAAGLGKQRLYVIPSKGLVIARQARQSPFDDAEFLRLVLGIKR